MYGHLRFGRDSRRKAAMMSSGLIGVALVVDDISKGCNLAFRYPAPPAEGASSFHRLSPSLLAKLFRPKSALCNQSFELSMDDLRFVSHPVLVPSSASSAASAGAQGAGQPAKQNETSMFNVIFALEKKPGAPDDQQRSVRGFHAAAARLANGLLHEELRAGFVSKEVRELLYLRDELAQNRRGRGTSSASSGANGMLPSGGAAGAGSGATSTTPSGGTTHHHHHHHRSEGGSSETAGSVAEVDQQTFIELSLTKSQLANDLKHVFHGLDESGTVQVVLNRWVKLSLTLSDAVDVQMNSIRPYHTLLLLKDEDKILDALPPDHSRQLRVLIEAVNPLKSFQDLSLETCIPIHQLFRLAAHLVYWGFGRIVDAITLHNIYQVHSGADLSVQAPLSQEFRHKFAPYELCEVLSTFSGSRRIGEYMKTLSGSKKVEYIHMLIWLLQHNFIVQLHRYIYFMIPSEGDYAPESDSFDDHSYSHHSHHHHHHRRRLHASSSGGSSMFGGTPPLGSDGAIMSPQLALASRNSDEESAIPMAVNVASQLLFTDQERDYLAKIAKPNPVFLLFKRLCVYFHGQHHLEEIMWRENLSRGELRTVVSTYQDIIVCCTHE